MLLKRYWGNFFFLNVLLGQVCSSTASWEFSDETMFHLKAMMCPSCNVLQECMCLDKLQNENFLQTPEFPTEQNRN